MSIIYERNEGRTSADNDDDDVDTSIYPSIDRIPQSLYPSLSSSFYRMMMIGKKMG
jgi:hypothetical protein